MAPSELLDYIQHARTAKIDDALTRAILKDTGWPSEDVGRAFAEVSGLQQPPMPTALRHSTSAGTARSGGTMWDAFEHILMFISLLVTSSSLAVILHHLVNRWLPPLPMPGQYYGADSDATTVLIALSAFLVSLPLFAFFFLRITRRTSQLPGLRQLTARKLLIYLTLIITFIILLFQLGKTLYSLLNGDVSVNFLLHFLVTVSITGVVFGYYVMQVAEDRKAL
jgi:hypothetical protein